MKQFQFAIASIVDANTGYGLVHGGDTRDTSAQERHAHEIRNRSVRAFFSSLKDSVASLVAALRERSRERRALAALSELSDYHLEDIGLTRGDVTAVELGQVSLQELNDDHRARMSAKPLGFAQAARVEQAQTGDASNEARYVEAQCA